MTCNEGPLSRGSIVLWTVALLSIVACAIGSRSASAIINQGDTIEWLCECQPHIAIVEVKLRPDVPASEGFRILNLPVARTVTVLKGHPPNQAAISCGVRVKPGGSASLLAFFDDKLEVSYAIALDDSESCSHSSAITADFRVLRGRHAILSAVNARLKRMRLLANTVRRSWKGVSAGPRYLTVPVPDWTAANRVLFAGSETLLNVPADSEYRAVFIRNLGSHYASVRASTALHLAEYPSTETVNVLRALLDDAAMDSLVAFGGSDAKHRTVVRYYPVRQAAYVALSKLGVAVPKPAGYVDNASIESLIRLNTADDQPTLFH